MFQSVLAHIAPFRKFVTLRSIVICSLALLCVAFTLFQNGGQTNAQSRSKAFDKGILAPQSNSWVDDQPASVVLGQANFTSASTGTGLNQMNQPFGVTVDAATGKVFVADLNNNRVLRFSSAAAMTNGGTAEAVFGGTGSVSANTMNGPIDITIDTSGNLWVADQTNHRVLRFGGAAALATNSPADVVLGQTGFTTSTTANPPTASSIGFPEGVFADAGGRLWVADFSNNRVLRFDVPLASGAAAGGVLGQPGFTTKVAAATQSRMNNPFGVTVDSGGRLWVADSSNTRVLRFENAATLANGPAADGVLGQPDFTTSAAPPPAAGSMNVPTGVAVDSSGRLYVADFNNNRVLIVNAAATKANGANADNVLGQPNFTTSAPGAVSASSLSLPPHLFFDNASQNLFVADSTNNRVLRFGPAGAPTAAGVSVSGRVSTPDGRGLRNAAVVITDSRGTVRNAITSSFGYYRFDDVPAGETYIVSVSSKRFQFTPQVVSLSDDLTGLDFIAEL